MNDPNRPDHGEPTDRQESVALQKIESPDLVADTESRIDGAATEVITVAERFAAQIKADQATDSAPSDAIDTITQVKKIAGRAVELRRVAREGLFATLGGAIDQRLSARRTRKRSEQLSIPDNKKIIDELRTSLDKLQIIRDKWAEKQASRLKKKQKEPNFTRLREEWFEQNQPAIEALFSAGVDFKAAVKNDDWRWDSISGDLTRLVTQATISSIRHGRMEQAMRLWKALPESASGVGRELIMDELAANYFTHIDALKTERFDLDAFFKKRTLYDDFITNTERILQADTSLMVAFQRYKDTLQRRTFIYRGGTDTSERALLEQPRVAVDALREFTPEEQYFILEQWRVGSGYPCSYWVDFLQHPRRQEIVALMRQLPRLRMDTRDEGGTRILDIINIEDEARERAWQKIKPAVTKKEFEGDWNTISAYFTIASIDGVSAEQVQALSLSQVNGWASIAGAYGVERLAALCTPENISNFSNHPNLSDTYRDPNRVGLRRFSQELSPVLRQYLPGIKIDSNVEERESTEAGLLSYVKSLDNFYEWAQAVPAHLRDSFFGALAPDQTPPPPFSRMHQGGKISVAETTVTNYLEYTALCPVEQRLSLREYWKSADFFSSKMWPEVKNGFLAYQAAGLEKSVGRTKEWLEVLHSAGRSGADQVNRLAYQVLTREPRYESQYHAETGGSDTLSRLYQLNELCTDYFGRDGDLVFRCYARDVTCQLNAEEEKLIIAFQAGEFSNPAVDYADWPIIVGDLVALATKLRDFQHAQEFKQFEELSTEEKKLYLELAPLVRTESGRESGQEQLLCAIREGRAEALKHFIQESGLQGFDIGITELMAARPECVGVFYYLSDYRSSSFATFETTAGIVRQLIALYDAGLPDKFKLETFEESSQHYDYIAKITAWDVIKLANMAELANELLPKATLKDLLYLSANETGERLLNRIRSAAFTWNQQLSPYNELPGEANLLQKEQKLRATGSLNTFLHGGGKYFPDEMLQLPDTILRDPLFWKYEIPLRYFEQEDLTKKCLEVAALLSAAELDAEHIYNLWDELFELLDNTPWLLEADTLKAIGPRNAYALFKAGITVEKFAELQAEVEHGRLIPEDDDMGEVYKHLFTVSPEKKRIVSQVQEEAGLDALPFKAIRHILHTSNEEKQPSEIIAELDVSCSVLPEWCAMRARSQHRAVAELAPTALDFFVTYFRKVKSAELDRLAGLSTEALGNMETLVKDWFNNDTRYCYLGENVFRLAEHEHFDLFADMIQHQEKANPVRIFLDLPTRELEQFCDGLTTEILDDITAIPDYVRFTITDTVALFSEPNDDRVRTALAGARQARALLGRQYSTSIYDLLLAGVTEADTAQLQLLQTRCFTQFDTQRLEELNRTVTEPELLAAIERVKNSISNQNPQTDIQTTLQTLKILSPDGSCAVIFDKISHFGWKLFQHTEFLQNELHFTADQLERLMLGVSTMVTFEELPAVWQTIQTLPPEYQHRVVLQLLKSIPKYSGAYKRFLDFSQTHAQEPKAAEEITEYIQQIHTFTSQVGFFHKHAFEIATRDSGTAAESIGIFSELPRHLKKDIKMLILDSCEIWLSAPKEKREKYVEILVLVDETPSQEIKRVARELMVAIIKTDDPLGSWNKIEAIFIKNNLPLIGKIYKIFEALHSPEKIQEILDNSPRLSPCLRQASKRRRAQIIFNDLLKIHIESGNRSLRQYLEVLKEGENIFERLDQSDTEMSENDGKRLKLYIAKLNTLFLESQLGVGSSPATIPKSTSLNEAKGVYDKLRRSLRARDGQTVSARVVEMFALRLGYQTIDEVLGAMRDKKEIAHQRGLQHTRDAINGQISLADGDILKGVDGQYVATILQNGSVAKEYLGVSSSQDNTPYDTDVAFIPAILGRSFAETVSSSIAKDYGNILFVIMDRGQFIRTSTETQAPIDPEKLELFKTGAAGETHYGIRTGFPATEIDFIINQSEQGNTKRLFIEIVQNGYYIPVVDKDGKIIFTPEQYERLRSFYTGLDRFDGQPFDYKKTEEQARHYDDVQHFKSDLGEERKRIDEVTRQIQGEIAQVLFEHGVQLKEAFDTSILGAELLDTGSTGRYTNLPHSFDFDLVLKLDLGDEAKVGALVRALKEKLLPTRDNSHGATDEGDMFQLRFEGAVIAGTPVDIDIAFVKKSELAVYGSHDAVKEKLDWIRQHNGDDAYEDVVANILVAKDVLKKSESYKKLEHGGMGGIGVENWILAHGGNFEHAAKAFWQAAHHESGDRRSLVDFQSQYQIIDPGVNVKFRAHDNFVKILKEQGYRNMLKAIGDYFDWT